MWDASIHPRLIFELLLLLMVANGTPILAKKAMGTFLAYPLDWGGKFPDRRRLLGPSKTIRGVVLAILATTLIAVLVGLPAAAGSVIGITAMLGDALSSFLKRRMELAPSSQAPGLDQIPESILPLLCSQPLVQSTIGDIVAAAILFFAGGVVISRLLFHLNIRDRPF